MENKYLKTFEQMSSEHEIYVIEFEKNNRTYFVALYDNEHVMTWRKEFAMQFSSMEKAENYIKESDLLTGLLWDKPYKIKTLSEAKSH